ncbi:hypothetical protein C0J52_03046 [Blattella germanica]|nr:hypothetical protein C0J52_03046 [Blattella germanica]
MQQVSHFKYLGCDITYSDSIEISNRIHKFQAVCGCINRTLRNKTRKDTQLRFYNTIALSQLLYGSETWTHRRKDINEIEASEMRFLHGVKGCTRLDKLRSADIRTELKITESAVDKVQKYKIKWKTHINRMSGERLPKLIQEYRPSGIRNIGRSRKRVPLAPVESARSEPARSTSEILLTFSVDNSVVLSSLCCVKKIVNTACERLEVSFIHCKVETSRLSPGLYIERRDVTKSITRRRCRHLVYAQLNNNNNNNRCSSHLLKTQSQFSKHNRDMINNIYYNTTIFTNAAVVNMISDMAGSSRSLSTSSESVSEYSMLENRRVQIGSELINERELTKAKPIFSSGDVDQPITSDVLNKGLTKEPAVSAEFRTTPGRHSYSFLIQVSLANKVVSDAQQRAVSKQVLHDILNDSKLLLSSWVNLPIRNISEEELMFVGLKDVIEVVESSTEYMSYSFKSVSPPPNKSYYPKLSTKLERTDEIELPKTAVIYHGGCWFGADAFGFINNID